MPEPVTPLGTDHAFVLQLQESRGGPGTCRAVTKLGAKWNKILAGQGK